MRRMILICAFLAGCSAPPPELAARVSVEARSGDFPMLLPLGPVFADVDALLPEDPGAIARTLAWRSADLRRRAAELQALPVN